MAARIPLLSAGIGPPVPDDPRRRIRPWAAAEGVDVERNREPLFEEVRPVLRVVATMAAIALARHVVLLLALLLLVRMV